MPETIRPGDLLKSQLALNPTMTRTKEEEEVLARLPASWRTTIEASEEWPFVDPDEAMSKPDPSFSDYPADSAPPEIIPFSEFEPWGMMDEETDRDYELFSYYRAMGLTRTQAETARHFGISQTYINKISSKRNWDERVRAWDQYREQVYTTEVIEGVRKMAKDHADIASKGIRALSKIFDELLKRVEDPTEMDMNELEELSFRGVFSLAEKAAKAIPNLMNAERLSRGLPTQLSAHVVVKDTRVTIQTTDELAEIVFGLQSVLSPPGENGDEPGNEEVIEVEGTEVEIEVLEEVLEESA